jgi:hypothetical protein
LMARTGLVYFTKMYSRKAPFTRYNRLLCCGTLELTFVSRRTNPEQTIRRLCAVWAASKGISMPGERPDVREFERWLEQNGYGHLLNSHTVSGARNDIQRWFNEEFKR